MVGEDEENLLTLFKEKGETKKKGTWERERIKLNKAP